MAVSENARKLKAIRKRAGVTVRGLARLVGWGHTRVQYWEDGTKAKYLPQSVIELFAPHLVGKGNPPVTDVEVFALAGMGPPTLTEIQVDEPPNVSAPIDTPPRLPERIEMPRTIPVLGVSVGETDDGDFIMNGEASDYVPQTPAIAFRKDIFACWTSGVSMVPWRQPRELVYVERNRQPVPGDHVVVEMKPTPPGNTRLAYLKKLVALTSTKVTVEQYNPKKTIEYDRRKVQRIYRVMEWSEVFGTSA